MNEFQVFMISRLAPQLSRWKGVATWVRHFPRLGRLAVTLVVLAWSSRAFGGEIHEAVRHRDLEKVKALLKDNPDLVLNRDGGETPWHLVCLAEIELQTRTASTNLTTPVVNTHTEFDQYPSSNVLAIAKVLIASGAEINIRDNSGRTPLVLAAYSGYPEVAQLLLANKAGVKVKDDAGSTALHWAASFGRQEVAALLLANEAEVDARDNEGATPLHHAAEKGHLDVAALLLANHAEVNAKDNQGATPLHWGGSGPRGRDAFALGCESWRGGNGEIDTGH